MTEQQPYQILAVLPGFELRNYPAHLVAQVTVRSTIEEAGGTAFRYLFGYISGRNHSSLPDPSREPGTDGMPVKIPMTAPVILQPQVPDETYTVAFVLPESMSADAAPDPDDPAVDVVAVPESRAAAASFSGRWTSRSYLDHAAALGEAVAAAGLIPLGLPRFALFDPPYKPWFLRRNEVVQTVE
ncbi:heme-binding protein [Arthrobacter sp. APC 3897]|mgnify:CR=1 FL=1|uniref:SOUL family heme-binding protein n=1 Tax=Arthrobacter sp. APC 3897 TaxID=3035204 RepID=UPI0025B42AA8|nr:heme-binding protein [Arthrobacter sp. APC 3897]MDN3483666.1 heme-binding protein [Arthrobacter sp. APC 3897]